MQSPSDVARNRKLLQVQAASGLLFALFLLLHLFNQMLAALGAGAYDGAQRVLRRGYQAPVVEVVLVLLPMLIHAAAGIARMWWRRQQPGPRGPVSTAARLHRMSGVILLVFFLGHVIATRGASFLYGIFPEFAGIAFTFRWIPAYFWPYYTSFALAGLYHLVYGMSVALPVLGVRGGAGLRRPVLLVSVVTGLGLALILGLLGQGGVIAEVGHPELSPYAKLVLRLSGKP